MAFMPLEFATARRNMVDSQVRTNDVTDVPVQEAMGRVARERFCRPGQQYLAYAEAQVEYAPGLHLLEPRDVSKLLQALSPRRGERALAVAAPYAAAVLAEVGLEVDLTVPAGEAEAACREALAGTPVRLLPGALAEAGGQGPYGVVICEGAVTAPPPAWGDAVGIGGRMALVLRQGPVGKANLWMRGEDGLLARREVFDSTPHLLPGFQPAHRFAF